MLLVICCLAGIAQDDVFLKFKNKYPDEVAVYVERSETLNLVVDGDSLRVFTDTFEDMVHLKDQAEAFASKRVYGSHFNHVENIKAKTLLWEKNRYKELAVSEFKRSSDRDRGIFYDDSYYYSFNFPSIGLRNRTQLEYREQLKDPRFLSGFIFGTYLPQGKVSFTVRTTKDVDIYFKVLNDPENEIDFRKTEKGNNVTYTWTGADIAAVKSEDKSPSIRYFAPQLICYVKSFRTKKGEVRVLSDLNDLYAWYNTFVRDLNKQNSDELVEIVKKIQAQSRDKRELVRNVFYWVQSNVRYIAFEQGMRGLIPHSGTYVCEKRYGDCKDMANLIVNMLAIAGVEAHHTWIGTRDLPYRYTELPSPLVDNHMIATWISDEGEYYFLDATGEYTPFGLPTSMIQGKEALIARGPDKFEVRVVPVIPKTVNYMTDSMRLKIDGNSLAGEGVSALHGFSKVFGAYQMNRTDDNDVKKYVTRLLGKGSNKFYLDRYEIRDLADRDNPTHIPYAFHIDDYYQKVGDEIFVNLNLNKDYYNASINTALRKTPIENEYLYTKFEHIVLSIPDGYAVEYLPENFVFSGDHFGCEISYVHKGNEIYYSKTFYLDYLLLEKTGFDNWNKAVKRISEAYKEAIILKKL